MSGFPKTRFPEGPIRLPLFEKGTEIPENEHGSREKFYGFIILLLKQLVKFFHLVLPADFINRLKNH
jgi:hypothetical protein